MGSILSSQVANSGYNTFLYILPLKLGKRVKKEVNYLFFYLFQR